MLQVRLLIACCLLSVLVPGRSPAIDGVVLINQQAALSGGTVPGDTAGFPVTIGNPGSYRLTSNLDLRNEPDAANLVAVHVTASDVTLDLNGFSIIGPTLCSGTPPAGAVTCAPSGDGRGVYADSPAAATNVVVRNGTITGMSDYGVNLTRGGIVEGLQLSNNRRAIIAGGTIVSDCTMWSNGEGLRSTTNVISGNTAVANEAGFASSSYSVIVGNIARGNHAAGFADINRSPVRHNVGSANGGHGFSAGSTGTANVFVGNAAFDNGGTGFAVTSSTTVIGNSARDNSTFALTVQTEGVIYGGNVFTTSNGAAETQVTGGTSIGNNVCGTNTTCP